MEHARYPWEANYLAAILETDDTKLPERIAEANSAISARLENNEKGELDGRGATSHQQGAWEPEAGYTGAPQQELKQPDLTAHEWQAASHGVSLCQSLCQSPQTKPVPGATAPRGSCTSGLVLQARGASVRRLHQGHS